MLNNKSYAIKCNPYQLTINMRRYWEKRKKLHDKRQCSLTYSADPVINKKGNNRKGKENFSKQRIKQPALGLVTAQQRSHSKQNPTWQLGPQVMIVHKGSTGREAECCDILDDNGAAEMS